MEKILIIGGGELSKQISHYVTFFDSKAQIIGYVDDTIAVGTVKFDKISLGNLNDIPDLYSSGKFDSLIIGIGYKHLQFKQILFEQFTEKYPFYSFIHPNSYIDNKALVGRGVVICPGVVIDQRAVIEDNVFLYNSVSIAHDSKVGAHSFIAPNVAVAGFVAVGKCCNLGINTTVIDNIKIHDNVQTGGGTVITKNIEQSGLYVGNPARFIR